MRTVRFLTPLVLLYLVYGFSLAIMSHVGFPQNMRDGLFVPYLADKPVGEDGYYMLTVAWNIADGHGIVYNYDVSTTGIQPLSTFIYALLAWIAQFLGGDKWTFIRSVLAFGTINLLLFAHLIGSITRAIINNQESRDLGYSFGFVLSIFNFALFRLFTYGLETGVYLTLFAVCILYTMKFTSKRIGFLDVVVLGILSGITIWARIDFAIVYLVFLGILLFRHQFNFLQTFLAGLTTTLIISPWFLYVFIVTGSWLPSSGTAQADLFTVQNLPLRFWTMGKAILSHLTPWIYSNAGGIFTLSAFITLMVFLAFAYRGKIIKAVQISIKQQPIFAAWFAGVAILVFIYPVFFWATHFYQRYSAPILPLVTPIMAIALVELIKSHSKKIISTMYS